MAELQTEMSPVDGQISNDVPGSVRVASATQGGAVIVTDEATLSNKLPGLLAGIAKTDFSVSSADTSGRQWPSVDGSLNFTWNTVSGRTVTKNSDHISYVETRGSTSAADSILCDISSVMAQPESTGFTIEVDFKIPDATPGSAYSSWFSVFGVGKDGSSGSERTVLSVGFDKGTKKLDIHYINEGSKYSSPESLDLSNRIKILASWDGAKFYLFVNGEKVRTVDCVVSDFSVFKKITLGHGEQGTSQTKVDFYSVNFTPKAITDPSCSVLYSGFKDFALTSGIENLVDTKVYNTRKLLEKRIFSKSFIIFKGGERHEGFINEITAPAYRIPACLITKKNTMLFFSDYRKNAGDETLIQNICARSTNNGIDFTYFSPATPYGSDGARRVMDSTILYENDNNTIWLMLGNWRRGGLNWTTNSAQPWVDDGKQAVLCKSTDDGQTFVQKTLSSAANSETNIQINNMPADCKGLLGGAGTGIKTSTGKLVMPIQWTKGGGTAYSGIMWSDNGGSTWNFGQGTLQDATMDPTVSGWGSTEHSVIEMPDGKIVSLARNSGRGRNDPRRAFYTEDLGETWHQFTPFDRKVSSGSGCQGAFITFTTKKGVKCYIATATSNIASDEVSGNRRGVAIYVFRYNPSEPENTTAVPVYTINSRESGGYSGLSYMSNGSGERLICCSETQDTDGMYSQTTSVRAEDITWLISRIESLSDMSSMELQGAIDKVDALETKCDQLDVKVDNYDRRIGVLETASGNAEDVYIKDGKVASLFVSGLNPDTKEWVSQEGNVTFKPTSTELTGYSPKTTGVSLSTNDSSLIRIHSPSNQDSTVLRVESFTASSLSIANEATVQFKLRINTKFSANWHCTLGMSNGNVEGAASNYRLGLAYNKDDMIQIMNCCKCSGNPQGASRLASEIPVGETIFVTLSYGTKFKVFINDKKLLEKDRNGGSWNFSEINQFVIGNVPNAGRTVDMEIGDLLIYNRELNETDVYKNFCSAMKVEDTVGFIKNLTTTNKATVVDAVNEINSTVTNVKDSLIQRIVGDIGKSVGKTENKGTYDSGDSIDIDSRTWTPTFPAPGTNIAWDDPSTYSVTCTKVNGRLKVVSNLNDQNRETHKGKNPNIDLNTLVGSGSVMELLIRFKYIDISSLSDWPCIIGIRSNDDTTDLVSVGIKKSSSSTNLYLDYHIKQDFTASSGNYNQSNIQPAEGNASDKDNVLRLSINGTTVKIYLNNTLGGTYTITGGVANLGKLYLCNAGRHKQNTKVEFSAISILGREATADDLYVLANYNDILQPSWLKSILDRLDALETPSLP